MRELPNTERRIKAARSWVPVVAAVPILHVLCLVLLPRPLLASNLVQLLAGVVAVGACLSQLRFVDVSYGRRCWMAVAASFGIWGTAQAIFTLSLIVPHLSQRTVRLEEALWFISGLPLMLAVNTFVEQGSDQALWFDRLQAALFFAVLSLLVFLPAVHLNMDTAYAIQDLALLLCCCLRLPSSRTSRELRFFLRLIFYLLVYAPATLAGDLLHQHGWPPGSLIDLLWTLPTTLFCALTLWHEISPWDLIRLGRVTSLARGLQGLSVTSLALLSMSVSAYLAMHAPVLGGVCIACSFGLFAFRTTIRERAWHHTHGQLKETVLQDALTGVGNRVLLRDRLASNLANPLTAGTTALIFADLDRFKSVNDSLGHALGDRLLVDVARRLEAASSSDALVCRLGGDEFVVLSAAADVSDAVRQAEALLDALHRPFRLGTHVIRSTASIGVVLASSGQSPDDLLRTADHAMYRAKQLGKDRVQFFDDVLLAQLSKRWRMEADLREAVEEREIEVDFQPIVSIESGLVVGFEALARWTHPEYGQVSPSDFIPLAEDTGLIAPLGAQVLERACYQVAEWNSRWNTRLSVSINISPRQFSDASLLPGILKTLVQTGLEPSLLLIEVTESALMIADETVRDMLAKARTRGIRVSLDDFGTGYSSLSFLLKLPFDELKMDRSFVSGMHSDPQRRELVRTIVQLGQGTGKRVVAEGVETLDDLRELASMGCECAQGWLFSRPHPGEVLAAKMATIRDHTLRLAHPEVAQEDIEPMRRHGLPQGREEAHTLAGSGIDDPRQVLAGFP